MKKFIVKYLAIFGAICLISLIYLGFMGIYIWKKKGEIKPNSMIEIVFSGSVGEMETEDPTARFMSSRELMMIDIIEALKRAAADDRIIGIVARIEQAQIGFAQIQEIRNAVIEFRQSGKIAIVYTDTFGEFGPGNGAYYLATAFDKIYLQPSGDICLTGLMFETPFVKGTLEKLGVVPRLDNRYEYKNMMNMFTEEKYDEPHREAMTEIMLSFYEQMVRDIAAARQLEESQVRDIINKGIFSASQALEAGLVDELRYSDEVIEIIRQQTSNTPNYYSCAAYLKNAGRFYDKGEVIALIYGTGDITRGESQYNPLYGTVSMGSVSITKAFQDAIEDDTVKAIVFRVDSPGGSYIASDSIYRETLKAKQANKPVIVSMGNVAGSGGYFVSMAADKILAQPSTITGSIGVVGGKMLTAGFWEKFGISWDEVHVGNKANMWTGITDFSPEQWNEVQLMLDRIYEDFTQKVSLSRNLPLEAVLEVSKGRIWSGEKAVRLQLVDGLGGIAQAIQLAKKAADIPAHKAIHLKRFPKPRSWIERLMDKFHLSTNHNHTTLETMESMMRQLQPYLKEIDPNAGVLVTPLPDIVW